MALRNPELYARNDDDCIYVADATQQIHIKTISLLRHIGLLIHFCSVKCYVSVKSVHYAILFGAFCRK